MIPFDLRQGRIQGGGDAEIRLDPPLLGYIYVQPRYRPERTKMRLDENWCEGAQKIGEKE